MTEIGTGPGEFCQSSLEFLKSFGTPCAENTFSIDKEWYEASCLRESLFLITGETINGRIGGDEFITYIPCLSIQKNRLEKLLELFFENWNSRQKDLSLDGNIFVSVGIGFYPDHGKDFQTLWSNADKALYSAKNNENNHICYCSELSDLHN